MKLKPLLVASANADSAEFDVSVSRCTKKFLFRIGRALPFVSILKGHRQPRKTLESFAEIKQRNIGIFGQQNIADLFFERINRGF